MHKIVEIFTQILRIMSVFVCFYFLVFRPIDFNGIMVLICNVIVFVTATVLNVFMQDELDEEY